MISIALHPFERLFYKAHKLMRIQANKSVVRAKEWWRGDDSLSEDWLPYITPTCGYDPELRRLVGGYIAQNLQVVLPANYESAYGVGEPAQIIVPPNQIWDITDIVGGVLCDANIGNRTCYIQVLGHIVDPDNPGPLAVMDFVLTTGIVLVATQFGGSVLTSGLAPNLTTNTAGALAFVANENFVPQRLNGGAIISHENDNFAVGVTDVMEIGVHYRRVA